MGDRKILIAVDGSSSADLAFNWYLDNMKQDKDLVILMHSAEYNVHIGLPGRAADVEAITKGMKEENDRIEAMLASYMEKLKKLQIHTQQIKEMGKNPGEVIIKTAETEGVHSIVIGSRGLGKIRRTFMGSVSDYVAKHAPALCAVTIVRDS
ncbi:hypothetical protein ACOMHN_039714 [Nucella lapillus]